MVLEILRFQAPTIPIIWTGVSSLSCSLHLDPLVLIDARIAGRPGQLSLVPVISKAWPKALKPRQPTPTLHDAV